MAVTAGVFPITGKISRESTVTYADDFISDTTISGKTRVRSMADAVYRVFNVKYAFLTNAEKQDLEDYYMLYRTTLTTFKWNYFGEVSGAPTYYVVFAEAPRLTMIGGTYWSAEVTLKQVY